MACFGYAAAPAACYGANAPGFTQLAWGHVFAFALFRADARRGRDLACKKKDLTPCCCRDPRVVVHKKTDA